MKYCILGRNDISINLLIDMMSKLPYEIVIYIDLSTNPKITTNRYNCI